MSMNRTRPTSKTVYGSFSGKNERESWINKYVLFLGKNDFAGVIVMNIPEKLGKIEKNIANST